MPTTNNSTRRGRGRGITHEDLAPKPRGFHLSSKTGALLTILCILFGLLCFILSLFAEATRSEVTWVLPNNNNGNRGHHLEKGKGEYKCMYSGNGKVPLICASIAFVTLAIAMLVQHSFMLIAITKTSPPVYISWDPQSSRPVKSLTCQAAFLFVSTWICFAVAEIMLLIGLSVESGHLKNWSTPNSSCLIVRQGVFTAAGVFSLVSVFLVAGLYATALRAQWLSQQLETIRREIIEASSLYASPPAPMSPHHNHTAQTSSSPDQTVQTPTLSQGQSMQINNKQSSFVEV